jgi:hypothetical protein
VQEARNVLELQLELLPGVDAVNETSLIDQLRRTGLPDNVFLRVEGVIGLRPDLRTGKFRRVVSQVGQPTHLASHCA